MMKRISRLLAAVCLAAGVLGLVACAPSAKQAGAETGEYIDDTVVTTRVKAALFNEPSLKSAELNVETYQGIVQLSGFVSSQAAIDKALDITRHIAGVVSVRNDMRLK